MKNRDKLSSVEDEVALHPEQNRERTHAENLPEAPEKEADSNACYYSSAAFEPGVGNGNSPEYRELLRREHVLEDRQAGRLSLCHTRAIFFLSEAQRLMIIDVCHRASFPGGSDRAGLPG